ncbi:MAG: hypothetical protein LBU34_05190 [Planctomycetaceae bacterium]|nr:hypothetical protein [Planctomycetaceae bacterium]
MHITPLAGLRFSFNTVAAIIPLATLSTINYQLSTINYQLSTINYQLILPFQGEVMVWGR